MSEITYKELDRLRATQKKLSIDTIIAKSNSALVNEALDLAWNIGWTHAIIALCEAGIIKRKI